MHATIIGAGDMARAIAARLLAGRHSVTLTARSRQNADELASALVEDGADPGSVRVADFGDPFDGSVVMLAVPYTAALELAEQRRAELGGSILVDVTNPVDWTTMDSLVTPADRSGAEEIADRLGDDARVVKAFNTTFAQRLLRAPGPYHPLDLFIAGDDDGAKRIIGDLVAGTGLRLIDAGPLRRARELEALGFLHITLQQQLGTSFETAIELAA